MYHFQTTIHALPSDVAAGETIDLPHGSLQTLRVEPPALAAPMGVSFEQAFQTLSNLPRMFVEPDGSLVWRGGQGAAAWQVDGVLYDRDGRLLYVELKGTCPAEEFNHLLTAFGWPKSPLMFQLPRHAVYLTEEEFRRYAVAN